jgi:hypothetical protein
LAQVVERAKAHLTAAFRGELTTLASTMTNVQTTAVVTVRSSTLAANALLSIGTELMYVTAVASDGVSCTVIRGHMGSTATTHTAGDAVEVNARFPGALIFLALLDEIDGLPDSIYSVVAETYSGVQFQETITLNASPINYANVYGVIDVRVSPQARYGFNFPLIAYTSWPRLEYARLVRSADPGDFTGGFYLNLGGRIEYGGDVRIVVALKPQVTDVNGALILSAVSDTVATLGLPSSMTDVLALGTALRLYQPRDIDRTTRQAQGESRFAQEVPVGGITQTAMGLSRIYDKRLNQEIDRLRARYPIRMAVQ